VTIRYLRLYLATVRFAWSRSLEFRLEFWFRILMDVLFYILNIIFFEVLYLHSPTLGGWTKSQVMIFITSVFVVDAVRMTFFVDNFWRFRQSVADGKFDYFLIKPASSLFLVSTRYFSVASCVNLLIAFGLLFSALSSYGPISQGAMLMYIAGMLNGILLIFCMQLLFAISVFWTQSPDGIEEILYVINRFGERPHTIYHPLLRFVFLTVVPVSLFASVPTEILFSENRVWLLLGSLTVSACAVVGLRILWKRALLNYSSASS